MPFGIGLAAILMTALALGQTGERPASAALIGSWVNANPSTATVTEIVVRAGDAGVMSRQVVEIESRVFLSS